MRYLTKEASVFACLGALPATPVTTPGQTEAAVDRAERLHSVQRFLACLDTEAAMEMAGEYAEARAAQMAAMRAAQGARGEIPEA